MESKLQETQSGARVAPAGDTARQFVLQGDSTQAVPGWILKLLPVALWVDGPYPKTQEFECPTCQSVYRLTDESFQDWQRILNGRIPAHRRYVCVHMGHFIE